MKNKAILERVVQQAGQQSIIEVEFETLEIKDQVVIFKNEENKLVYIVNTKNYNINFE